MFLNGNAYYQAIKNLLESSESIDIAVAFLGEGAEDLLLRAKTGRIICNLESGATNPSVIGHLLNNSSLKSKSLANLHAKTFIGDKAVISGSANLSANGLGLEHTEVAHWEEAGFLTKNASAISSAHDWFNKLWNGPHAKLIDQNDLEQAEAIWQRRRQWRPSDLRFGKPKGLFDRIMEDWTYCKDRPLYLVAFQDWGTPEADNAFTRFAQAQESSYHFPMDYYENWSQLPNNAFLIDFYVSPKGRIIKPNGFYWTGPEKIIVKFNYDEGREQGKLRIVFKLKKYEGLSILPKEQKEFSDFIEPHITALLGKKKSTCVSLYKAFSKILKK